MKKKILLLSFGCLMASTIFAGFSGAGFPFNPRGYQEALPQDQWPKEVTLYMNNSTGLDFLLDATCRKNPGDAIALPARSNASIDLKFDGSSGCKVLAVFKEYPDRQAVMCLDQYGCEHNCDPNDPDCIGGFCNNLGFSWVRGGDGDMGVGGDSCKRGGVGVPHTKDTNALSYGISLHDKTDNRSLCQYFLNDLDRLNQARQRPSLKEMIKNMCVGTQAANGFIWNKPPDFQVKCGKGTRVNKKENGCECINPNKKLNGTTGNIGGSITQDEWECD